MGRELGGEGGGIGANWELENAPRARMNGIAFASSNNLEARSRAGVSLFLPRPFPPFLGFHSRPKTLQTRLSQRGKYCVEKLGVLNQPDQAL